MKKIIALLLSVTLLISLAPLSVGATADFSHEFGQLSSPYPNEEYLTIQELSDTYHISQLDLLMQLNKGYSLKELQQALKLQKTQGESLDAILYHLNPEVDNRLEKLQVKTNKEEVNSVTPITYDMPEGEYVPFTGETTFDSDKIYLLPERGRSTVSQSVYGKTVTDTVYAKSMQAMAAYNYPTSYDALAVQRMNIKADTAPYAVGGNESVSTVDGSLQVEQVDMTLPGRNGLSFALKRKYSSSDAIYYDKNYSQEPIYQVCYYPDLVSKMEYLYGGGSPAPYGSTSPFHFLPPSFAYTSFVQFLGEYTYWDYPSYYSPVWDFEERTKKTFEESWYYVNPDDSASKPLVQSTVTLKGVPFLLRAYPTGRVLEQTNSRKVIGIGYKNDVKSKLTEENRFPLGKGWSWDLPYIQTKSNGKKYITLFGGSTYELNGFTLKGYPWKDLTLSADTTVQVNNEISYYVLKNLEGQKQYFTSDGRLLQISDAYNNTVQFKYTYVAPYGSALSTITDAIGNTIQITYSDTGITLTQGDQTVTYTKTPSPVQDKQFLSQVTDAMGRTTSYVYDTQNAPFDIVGGGYSKDNPVALLKQVYHPTSARTDYTYTSFSRTIGYQATETVYRVSSRQDVIAHVNGGGSAYNHVTYAYQGDGGKVQNSSYSFSTTVNNGRLSTTYSFDKVYVDDQTPEALYNTQIKQDDGTLQVIQDMEYDRVNRRPTPVKTTTYSKQGGQTSTPQVMTRIYNEYKNVVTETDPNQVTVTYGYDPATHLFSSSVTPIDTGLNQYVEVERYPTVNSIKAARVKENNAAGRILAETGYSYDAYGNPVEVTIRDDNRTITMNAGYGSVYGYGFPTSQSITVTDANGEPSTVTQSFAYNSQTGQMTRFTDGRGYSTDYTYDKLGRMLTLKNPDGTQHTVTYNDSQNTVLETDPTNVQLLTQWNPLGWKTQTGIVGKSPATYGYDAFGRLAWTEDGAHNRTTYGYNAWDQTTQVVMPGPGSPTATTAYDVLNRIVTQTDPEGYRSKTWRDLLGRVTQVEGYSPAGGRTSSSRMSYTLAGQVKVQEDGIESEAGGISKTQFAYDAMGRLTSVTNALNETTGYTYSLANQLTRIQYPDGNQLVKAYDERGRLIRRTDPAGGVDTYFYDANSNLVKKIDRMGQATTYAYDSRNFLDAVYDALETITYTQDAAGRRTSMKDQTGITSYRYEAGGGWLTKVIYPDKREITYQYDAQGNRTRMTDPFGISTQYGYDAQNRLERVGTTTGQWDAVYTYRKNSQPLGVSRSNGLTTTWGYDTLKTTLTQGLSGQGNLHAYEYQYDMKGNIAKRVEDEQPQTFGYDKLSRIQDTSEYGESYTYDSRGNRVTLLSEKSLSLNEQKYQYDRKNRLTQVTEGTGSTVSYRYNGDGLLTERTEGGQTTRYYYDGANIIAEGKVNGGTVTHKASYLRGTQLEARIDASGSKSYYVLNGHGDVVGLVDGTGNTLNSYTYDMWGAPTTASESLPQPFRYSGELWDSSTGLQYLRARWYDPSIGRFITQDTYEGDITNPLSLNLYAYVDNNPLTRWDPSGHGWLQKLSGFLDAAVDSVTFGGWSTFNDFIGNKASTSDDYNQSYSDTTIFITDASLALPPADAVAFDMSLQAVRLMSADRILIQSGGRTLSLKEWQRREDMATELYNQFRRSANDINTIANNVGMSESKINTVKNHLFHNEIKFSNGTVRQFDNDYEIATAWERLTNATYNSNDLLLLEHEYYEATYMAQFGADYEAAHAAANGFYNWEKAIGK